MFLVYKVVCNITNDVYFGMTSKTLKRRIWNHKWSESKCTCKSIIDRGNYKSCILCRCNNKESALFCEKHFIQNQPCINIMSKYPFGPLEYKRTWSANNRDRIKIYNQRRQKINIINNEIKRLSSIEI